MSATTPPRVPSFRLRRVVESYNVAGIGGDDVVDALECGHRWRFRAADYRRALRRRCHGCARRP